MEHRRVFLFDVYRLGDHLYDLALGCSLRSAWNTEAMTLITSPAVRHCGLVEVLGFNRLEVPSPWLQAGWWKRPFSVFQSAVEIRWRIGIPEGNSVGVDPRGGLIGRTLASGIRRLRTYSYQGSPERSFSCRLLGYHSEHIFLSRCRFAAELGLRRPDGFELIEWPFLQKIYTRSPNDRRILLCPEASMRGKESGLGFWLELEARLFQEGFDPITVLSEKSHWYVESRNTFSKIWMGTIDGLGKLMALTGAVIAVDSFVGHFAAAIGVPVLSLFGPTDPVLWRPWGNGNIALRSPAAKGLEFSRKAIEAKGPKLMEDLDVDYVLGEFRKWFDGFR